ncbi:MAG: ACT domain-containing protein [Parolsenella sp.]|uniref:ACT domain-containing protein n=1 Tax=unclassified Parolsenella TaxID=2623992 RepID=UPI002A752B1F|nr:ACT domain-containing protein [Parolsenella sp.]MCI5949696.1 ACT domain-containing protein [Coriobacteriaceae bacterium]MDY3291483.1 ACT domain-containing protein [Parolsenella sp.]
MSDEITNANTTSNRAIVSVLGADRSGIVAAVAGLLAERNVNILDISQTILQGLFTMTTLVDLGDADFAEIHVGLDELAKQLGVQITIQREDVFKFMYRL